jgi:FkbH-like protein
MKLVDALNLLKTPPAAAAAPWDVALVCGFTPAHLETFLAAHLRRLDPARRPVVRTGLFGDCLGNLERAAEGSPAAVALVVEWPDLDPRLGLRQLGGWGPAALDDILATATARAARLAEAIGRAAARAPLAFCPPTLPIPPLAYHPVGQAGAFELGLRRVVADLAARAAEGPGVRVVNLQQLDGLSPPRERLDVRTELSSGFPYRVPHASEVAEALARLLRPPAPKKGLITDLDDTLWRGIVGDIGAEAIGWDLDRRAQVHGLYQQLLAALADAGVLVAVASKNDPRRVDEALGRADLVLTRDRVFPLEVSWGPKSEAVGRILRAWNVGADSVVFVDDSPMELAEVSAAHPEIDCRLFPKSDDQAAYEFLVRLRDAFGKPTVSSEDALRRESLRRSADAFGPAGGGGTPDGFLERVEAEITFEGAREPVDPRALELINKTNQFNLNGRRYADGEWLAHLRDPGTFLLVVSYKDKFGPLGKIAVLTGRADSAAGTVDVSQWVMSCRAFSRRIEHQCLAALFRATGARSLVFAFQETPRNGPLREFFTGFLDAPPGDPLILDRDRFEACCPPLHHQIRGLDGWPIPVPV